MITRTAAQELLECAEFYPVVTVFGPRQSGKTTLVRTCFPTYEYVNLESPALRAAAAADPAAFLNAHPAPVILDEVQRVPDLLSEIQVRVDEQKQPGAYALTGSRNFLQMEGGQQSLAGRTSVTDLLPLSLTEVADAGLAPATPEEWVFRGGYPKLFDAPRMPPSRYYGDYIRTYVEKDVGEGAKVTKLSEFRRAMQVLALEAGSLYNQAGVASDTGVQVNTLKAWISILESTYLVFRLSPYFSNRIKRLVKAPKLYCVDTGLACRLCGITSPRELLTSGQWGHLFENAVVAEALKACAGCEGLEASFLRDNNGAEVDLLLERGGRAWSLCEVKASQAWGAADFRNLERFGDALGVPVERRFVVYAGDVRYDTVHGVALPWRRIAELWAPGPFSSR